MTLNLFRGSRINPNLSAWAQVHGPPSPPPRHSSPRTRETLRTRHLGSSCHRWVVSRRCHAPLSLLSCLDLGNHGRENHRHSPLVPHQGHHANSIFSRGGHSRRPRPYPCPHASVSCITTSPPRRQPARRFPPTHPNIQHHRRTVPANRAPRLHTITRSGRPAARQQASPWATSKGGRRYWARTATSPCTHFRGWRP
jgi:hypothetical protein